MGDTKLLALKGGVEWSLADSKLELSLIEHMNRGVFQSPVGTICPAVPEVDQSHLKFGTHLKYDYLIGEKTKLMSSNRSNTEVSDVKRYCLVNFVWTFVKTDDDCVHWKNAKYGHQFCIKKHCRNKTLHNNILYLSGTCTRTAK